MKTFVIIILYILMAFILGFFVFLYEYNKYKKQNDTANVYKFFREEFNDASILLFIYLLLSPLIFVIDVLVAISQYIEDIVLYIVDKIFDNNETEE